MVSRVVGRLGERLARAEALGEAERIVRDAARALGFSRCELVPCNVVRKHACGISVPVLGHRGIVATLACLADEPVPRAAERQVAMLAMQVSVWWTTHAVDDQWRLAALTPRQREIARLAASGCTNAHIADRLAISVNTVKLRLKQVFERLGVNNRTELANVLREA